MVLNTICGKGLIVMNSRTGKDILGKRFKMLTVVEFREVRNNHSYWLCKCDCGKEKVVARRHLVSGNVKSCGCLRGLENKSRVKHGLSSSNIYNRYFGMIKRCCLPSNPSYKHYGQRGISVCEEWADKDSGFVNFKNWAYSNGYEKGLQLDRIDVNGNYEPMNCRWATSAQNANNKRSNVPITIGGETKNLYEWAKLAGIHYQTISERIKRGWPEDKLLKPTGRGD